MIKRKVTNILQILVPLFSTLFIFLIATLIIVYANGYKINFTTKKVIKTGTITVATKPSGASIYLDNQLIDKSNTILPDIVTGLHHIKIEKNNYYPYERDIYVEHGYAYTIHIPLIKQTEQQDFLNLANISDLKILKIINSTHTIYLVAKEQESNPQNTVTNTATVSTSATNNTALVQTNTHISNGYKSLSIYKVDIGKRFFIEKSYNLNRLISITIPKESEILNIIPINKDRLIFHIGNDKISHYYVIDADQLHDTDINIKDLVPDKTLDYYTGQGFSIYTDPHSYYILLASKDKIISYNPQNLQKTIIYEKINPKIQFNWTYTSSNIFIIIQNEVSDQDSNGDQDKNSQQKIKLQTEIIAKKYDGRIDDDYKFPQFEDLTRVSYIKAIDSNAGTVLIFSDKNGTYMLGDLFTDSGKKITTQSKRIKNFSINHYPEESLSRIQIFNAPINSFILNAPIDQIVFTDEDRHNLYRFKYNKDELDHDEQLGLTKLKSSDNYINLVQNIKNPEFILIYEEPTKQNENTNNNLSIKTIHGDNEYQLIHANITSVKTYLHGSVILYIDKEQHIFTIETD